MAGFTDFFLTQKAMRWNYVSSLGCFIAARRHIPSIASQTAAPLNPPAADDAEVFMSCRVLWANDWIPGSPQPWKASSSLTQICTSSSRLWETWEVDVLPIILHARVLLFFPSCTITTIARLTGFVDVLSRSSWMWSDLQLDYGCKMLNPLKFFTICWSLLSVPAIKWIV